MAAKRIATAWPATGRRPTANGRQQGQPVRHRLRPQPVLGPLGLHRRPAGRSARTGGRAARVWGGQARQSWFLGPAFKDIGAERRPPAAPGSHPLGRPLRHRRPGRRTAHGASGQTHRDRGRAVRRSPYRMDRAGCAATFGLRHDDQMDARVTATGGDFNLEQRRQSPMPARPAPNSASCFGPFNLLGATEFYANWGHGFHSNDARGATSTDQSGGRLERRSAGYRCWSRPEASEIGLRADAAAGLEQQSGALENGSRLGAGLHRRRRRHRAQGRLPPPWPRMVELPSSRPDGLDRRRGCRPGPRPASRPPTPTTAARRVPNAIPLTASLGAAPSTPADRWFGGVAPALSGRLSRWKKPAEEKSTALPGWPTSSSAIGSIPRCSSPSTYSTCSTKQANDIEYWGGACTRRETLSGQLRRRHRWHASSIRSSRAQCVSACELVSNEQGLQAGGNHFG
jgi:hypothetical protein